MDTKTLLRSTTVYGTKSSSGELGFPLSLKQYYTEVVFETSGFLENT